VCALGHLAERTTFLPEVDDDADTTALGASHALFNRIHQVRLAARAVQWRQQ
jgi:hypothetical protein